MPASTNLWMGLAGLACLVVGVFVHWNVIRASRGWDGLIALGPLCIAVSLAVFAPEHFCGPEFVQAMVPPWMPLHLFWAYFVGGALAAAAASLALRKAVRLSSTLLGLMFVLFVLMLYLPSALRHPHNRFGWAYLLRDLSFGAGAWALAGVYGRFASPRLSEGLVTFGRLVIGVAALVYALDHFFHPEFAPGVPLEEVTPAWVPFPRLWGCLAGAVLLVSGISLLLNRNARRAAAWIGALMTFLTVFLYLVILMLAKGRSVDVVNDALNYVADTLLYAGSALVLAAALPRAQP